MEADAFDYVAVHPRGGGEAVLVPDLRDAKRWRRVPTGDRRTGAWRDLTDCYAINAQELVSGWRFLAFAAETNRKASGYRPQMHVIGSAGTPEEVREMCAAHLELSTELRSWIHPLRWPEFSRKRERA